MFFVGGLGKEVKVHDGNSKRQRQVDAHMNQKICFCVPLKCERAVLNFTKFVGSHHLSVILLYYGSKRTA